MSLSLFIILKRFTLGRNSHIHKNEKAGMFMSGLASFGQLGLISDTNECYKPRKGLNDNKGPQKHIWKKPIRSDGFPTILM